MEVKASNLFRTPDSAEEVITFANNSQNPAEVMMAVMMYQNWIVKNFTLTEKKDEKNRDDNKKQTTAI